MPEHKQIVLTYDWDEEPELDGEGNPTGLVVMIVKTVAYPDGYRLNYDPAAMTDFAKAATVQSLWDNQGKPPA